MDEIAEYLTKHNNCGLKFKWVKSTYFGNECYELCYGIKNPLMKAYTISTENPYYITTVRVYTNTKLDYLFKTLGGRKIYYLNQGIEYFLIVPKDELEMELFKLC